MSKCKIPYPHDFKDYPCKKCNSTSKEEIIVDILGISLIIIGCIIML